MPYYIAKKICEAVNIRALMSEYGEIKNNTMRCIFHNDHDASMHIYENTNSFYCFGCQAGGDPISFIMKAQNIEFTEACKYLIDRYGIQEAEQEEKSKIKKYIPFAEYQQLSRQAAEWSITTYKYLAEALERAKEQTTKQEIQKYIDILLIGSQKDKSEFYIEELKNNYEIVQGYCMAFNLLEVPEVDVPGNFEPLHIDRNDMNFYSRYKKYNNVVPAHQREQVTQLTELPYYFIEDDKGKLKIQPALLAEYIRNNSKYIFARSNAKEQKPTRYWYSSGAYREITDDELKGIIKEHITKYDMLALGMKTVEEVFKNIITDLKFTDHDKINADENIINFQNGLLYLDTMELKPHTPDIYTTIQIPCKWTGSAGATPVFDKFMNDFTSGNEEVKRFLLQYMGMCISNVPGYYPKKALFIVGPGNSGKTQLLKLTIKLLGEKKNCEASSLEKLESRFGASDIENKRLTYNPDMTYATLKELAIFKQITGGDYLRSEAKYKAAHSFLYRGLLWFCTNNLPKFGGDRGQWVYDRMIILKADNVIPEEKRDAELINKMYAEREAIVYKAVMALKEVIKNGYRYNVPQCCIDNMKQYQQDNSPVLTFFNECCIMREQENGTKIKDSCTTKKMYEVFKAWCKDNNGGYCLGIQEFNSELLDLFEFTETNQLYTKIMGTRYYIFTLNLEYKEYYKEIYGVDRVQ